MGREIRCLTKLEECDLDWRFDGCILICVCVRARLVLISRKTDPVSGKAGTRSTISEDGSKGGWCFVWNGGGSPILASPQSLLLLPFNSLLALCLSLPSPTS